LTALAEDSKVQLKNKKSSWKIAMFGGKSCVSAENEIGSRKFKSSAGNSKVQLKI
jgi:hypothetical protein